MRRQLPTILAALVILVILVLYMVTYQVRTTEVAVLKTFGKAGPEDVIMGGARFGFKWPPPIQQIVKFDNRVHIFDDTFEETLTRDQKNIIVTAFIGWKIADPLLFLQRVKTTANAEELIKSKIRNYKTQIIGKYDFANFVSTDPEDLKFREIEQEILQRVREDARSEYGIDVVTLGIKRLGLPEKTTEKVFDRMRKTRQKLAQEYRSSGEAEAARIEAEAEADKQTILAFARAQATAIRSEGEKLALEYYRRYRGHEDFALYLRILDFFRETLDQNTTIFLDSAPFDMFRTGPLKDGQLSLPQVPVMPGEPAEAGESEPVTPASAVEPAQGAATP